MTTTERHRSLGAFAASWDALVDALPLPSPFLRSWWLENVAVSEPCFLLVLDGSELIGGLALEVDRPLGVSRVRTLGMALASDHVDLVAAPGRTEDVAAGVRAALDDLGTGIVDLVGCREGADLAAVLVEPRIEAVDVAPWAPVSGGFDEYMAARPSTLRSQVDRPARRLRREGAEHRVVTAAEVDRALRALRDLHGEVFGPRSQFLPHFEGFSRAAREGIARGELVMHEMHVDGRVIATNVCFEVAGTMSYYQSGRDLDHRWRGSGMTLIAHAIEHALDAGCRELDFLRGSERYKREFADRERKILRIRTTPRRRGRAVATLLSAARSARTALSGGGPSPRAAPRRGHPPAG